MSGGDETSFETQILSMHKKVVGEYRLGEILGEGSYSTVVEGTHIATGQTFALKILEKRHIVKEKKVKYVNIEKQVFSMASSHPFIVKLYTTFQDSSSLYFVLEKGETELLTVIRRRGGLSVDLTVFYVAELLIALNYLHSLAIIHRDFKPENVLLDKMRHLKLTDFGTAKILEDASQADESIKVEENSKSVGTATSFVGTAEYVSPELLNDKVATFSSDIWALGCVMFQMIAARPPFKAANDYQIFQKITKLDYEFPKGFPGDLKSMIEVILIRDPLSRPGLLTLSEDPIFSHLKDDGVPLLQSSLWLKTVPPESSFLRTGNGSGGISLTTDNRLSDLDLVSPMTPMSPGGENGEWSRFLYDGEHILYSGVIQKKKYFFGKNHTRYLILTDKPRLMYIDPENMTEKGEIPWSKSLEVEYKGEHSFAIITKDRVWNMTDVEGNAGAWIKAILALRDSIETKTDT